MAYTKFFSHVDLRVIKWRQFILPICGYYLGAYLEYEEVKRLDKFRDKSALFYREKKEGEEPSWPKRYPTLL